ncbi:MAG: UDP-glucuronic acid decarboxylase family protein [Patescibacteria group bacterium]|jgi:UDP-glucuronate decarboxylase
MTKTYLISGGAGFLGSHLSERLLKEGQKVICLDNFITGLKSNMAPFSANPNFTFINQNICKTIDIVDATPKIDYVLNYACPASPTDYRNHPIETLEACSIGTKNMLEIAKEHKARFFHTSTSEVYGDPKEHPQTESYWGHVNSYGERSCYDEGKRYAESLIYIYRKDFGVDTGIIRIFNTYGPRMRPLDGRVVSTFIRQALEGEDITIFGRGEQTRSFCYVDDQIEAQMKMIHSEEEGPINIGNPTEFSMIELAEKIKDITKSQSRIVYRPLPKDDPTQRKPDISLAKKRLLWEPKVDLTEGLRKTISWFTGARY